MARDEEPRPGVSTRPILPLPNSDAFVRLGADATAVSAEGGTVEVTQPLGGPFEVNTIAFAVSREMAIDLGLVEPTEEERAAFAAAAELLRERVAAVRAQPGPELTLEALLDLLGWPAEFAAHRLHPGCSCVIDDDPYLCSWAVELGWTWDWESGSVVRDA